MLTHAFARLVRRVAAVIVTLSMAGCAASAGTSSQSPAPARSAHVPSQPHAVVSVRVRSGAFRTIKPGTPVDSKQLTTRVSLAFAQESEPAAGESLHAVVWAYRSTDGGRVWHATSALAPP